MKTLLATAILLSLATTAEAGRCYGGRCAPRHHVRHCEPCPPPQAVALSPVTYDRALVPVYKRCGLFGCRTRLVYEMQMTPRAMVDAGAPVEPNTINPVLDTPEVTQ